MTALDRALSWFLDPVPPAPEVAEADSPADEPGPERLHARARLSGSSGRSATTARPIGSAVVVGRPGQAEPVAAAVALALGRNARSRAATVAVIAAGNPDAGASGSSAPGSVAPVALAAGRGAPETPAGGGTPAPADAGRGDTGRPAGHGARAARRLAARLDAHGLPARPRGRLVWVGLPVEHRQAAARRALLVGAPAVLAVTAPRNEEIEELLAEQDLLLFVMADPGGPLARVAALAPGGVPVAVTRPLSRGPSRSLALVGVSAPRSVRELVTHGADSAATLRAAA